MPTFKVEEEIYLNKMTKCYLKILTLNKRPDNSPLKDCIKELPRQKLSPFDYNSHCDTKPHCLFAIINPNTGDFIKSDEIDVFVDILINSNYSIDYKLTKLVKDKNERLLFYFN